MSRLQSTRRLPLLAGSSLAAAGFSAMILAGAAALAPSAMAQTCTPATSPGANPGADTYTCSGTPFAGGITYSSAGNLTVNATTSGMDIGATGISLTGNGADTVTFGSTVEIDGVGLTGALLDITSGSGVITVNAAALDADQTSATAMTYGVRASSTTGSINMTITGAVDAEANGGNLAGQAGVFASTGGAGAVSLTTSAVQGRLYGIRAAATGSGALTINAGSNQINAHASAGIASIHATAGTGTVTINGTGSGGATGVYIDAGGDVTFTGSASGTQYGVYLEDVAAGTTSTLNLGAATGGTAAIFAQGDGELVVNVIGGLVTPNFDFTGMADTVDVVMAEGALWRVTGSTTVSDGNFNIIIGEGAALATGSVLNGNANLDVFEAPNVITFADPDSVLVNEGVIAVGVGISDGAGSSVANKEHEAELRLVGLGEFRHSGLILLGNSGITTGSPPGTINGIFINETDHWNDDVLSLPGAHWVGEEGEILMDIYLGGSQANCDRDPVNGDLGAADCVKIVGGSTEGVTYITLSERLAGDRGRITDDGIVLVDVSGGDSAQGHFLLDPAAPGYTPAFGGSIDKGLYQYALIYDDTTQQHILRGMPSGAAHQLPALAATAQGLWRLSTGTWFERQADLRGDLQDGVGGGAWMRVSGESADRDLVNTSTAGGQDFAFDNTYSQSSYAMTGGLDLMSGAAGDSAYVVGLMAGYAHAEVEYDASPNTQQIDGWSGGAYASYLSGGLYVDAAINANRLVMDNDVPAFRFFPSSAIVSSRLMMVGAQVDAGWRYPLSGGAFVEPLAGLSYVRASYDDIVFRPDDASRPGLEVSYDDPTSLRAGVGGRVGIDSDFGSLRTQVSVLGRVWNEFEGENGAIIHNLAFPNDPDIAMTDDFSGQFSELALGASVYGPGGVVSGFVTLGGRFGDDYQARTGSLGLRVAW